MTAVSRGQTVYVACEVHPGPFDERLVVIDIEESRIQGFVKAEYVHQVNGKGFVQAVVTEVQQGSVSIKLPGSFFETAMGRASMSPDWANQHLKLAPA
ncbi:MAG: hypothetical protein ACR2M4_12430 [Actinomycetota bacterium]